MSRVRIKATPIKVYSTDCKATGIAAKYQFEEEQQRFRQERIQAKQKNWDNLKAFMQQEFTRLEMEKAVRV
jgi:hypothetical protein